MATTTTTKEDRKATTAAAALSAPSAAAAAAAAVRPIPSRIVRNPNPYNRFLEQAEEAIEHELHDMYADASVPQHMYDETRGVGKEDDLVTTAAKDEEEEEESSSSKIGSSSSSSTIVDPTIHKGIVQWFDPKKGYGFLQEATSEEEAASAVFVHHSGIQDHERDRYYHKLLAHESVEFQIAYDKYGRTRAVHVTGPHGTPVKAILQQQLDENNQQ